MTNVNDRAQVRGRSAEGAALAPCVERPGTGGTLREENVMSKSTKSAAAATPSIAAFATQLGADLLPSPTVAKAAATRQSTPAITLAPAAPRRFATIAAEIEALTAEAKKAAAERKAQLAKLRAEKKAAAKAERIARTPKPQTLGSVLIVRRGKKGAKENFVAVLVRGRSTGKPVLMALPPVSWQLILGSSDAIRDAIENLKLQS